MSWTHARMMVTWKGFLFPATWTAGRGVKSVREGRSVGLFRRTEVGRVGVEQCQTDELAGRGEPFSRFPGRSVSPCSPAASSLATAR